MVTLVHDSLPVMESDSGMQDGMEHMKTNIQVHKDFEITVVNVYLPPAIKITTNMLNTLVPTKKHYIILGDFNAKHIAWNCGNQNQRGEVVYEWIIENHLILLNKDKRSTYQSASTGSCSSIDLTVVSLDLYSRVNDWQVGQDMSSDHFPIITSILHRKPSKDTLPLSTKWKIKSAHWEEFKEETKNISLSNRCV